jgi:hypothetical protein
MGGAGGVEPLVFDEVLGVFVEAIAATPPPCTLALLAPRV